MFKDVEKQSESKAKMDNRATINKNILSNEKIKISVRELVEFVLRKGDLDNRFMGTARAQQGTLAHKKLQKSNETVFYKYEKEYVLTYSIYYDEFTIEIEGRADGIITNEDGTIVVDEIKTTTRDLSYIDEDYNELHWAQAKCYGYIYSYDNHLDNIDIQLSYYELTTEQIKSFKKTYTQKELESYFFSLIEMYYSWAKQQFHWKKIRDSSIQNTSFPFQTYRKGQRKLAVAVYKTIEEGKKLFIQAPTGIGKTISTVFPTVKAMGEGLVSKIFYLTAKTVTRTVAEEAFNGLREKGLQIRTITLTAKEKICFNKEAGCNPEQCSFAKGHYDRVNQAIRALIACQQNITREVVEKYALEFNVCPFEFSLDLALLCDAVICDYNYAFDPSASLKRFFEEKEGGKSRNSTDNAGFVFLIDEAHNLVDRAREMFSAELIKSQVLTCKKLMKGKVQNLYNDLDKINAYFINLRHKLESENLKYHISAEPQDKLYPLIRMFLKNAEEYLTKSSGTEGYEEILDFYFKCRAFTNISEMYNDSYVTYIDSENKDIKIKLFCVDPSSILKENMKKSKAAVLFSATLTPMDYFKEVLGGEDRDYRMRLPSPFDKNNLKVTIAHDVSTRYIHREYSYEAISAYIEDFIKFKKGNYIVFFPSYAYMNKVYDVLKERLDKHEENGENSIEIAIQNGIMTEKEKEEFIKRFDENNERTFLAFAVLGGVFSEGIDLKGDRLIGAVIVGVGLPQICIERDIIKDYYDKKFRRGYEYAYMYPGMNKVLQAAGRVIRTEEDKGGILLIDERYNTQAYKRLFPMEWL